jgi:hypothetical protein
MLERCYCPLTRNTAVRSAGLKGKPNIYITMPTLSPKVTCFWSSQGMEVCFRAGLYFVGALRV